MAATTKAQTFHPMSRSKLARRARLAAAKAEPPAGIEPAAAASAQVAYDIGLAVLELAKQANGVGLTTLGYLLEAAALEAGAAAASTQCVADASN